MSTPSSADQDVYNELSCYTISHSDHSFIYQHIVDAYAAQYADGGTKPISIVFALIGLYLYIEKGFTGRQVQRTHMHLGKRRKTWLQLSFPRERGSITVSAVLAAPPGQQRDDMIRKWCVAVWEAWEESHDQIRGMVKEELDI